MKQKEIQVLMVESGKHPVETALQNDLESLQKAVSVGSEHQGMIEIIGIDDRVCVLCNEEGKLFGKPEYFTEKAVTDAIATYFLEGWNFE